MITRLVCMTFYPEGVDDFLRTFYERKHLIASFKGCLGVQLLRDTDNANTFFTYSKWQTADDLENYRRSEFFAETWALAKKHFCAKPVAWSVADAD